MGKQFVNKVASNSYLPCRWSKDGLQLFNVLANEVIIDQNQHGKEFDNDFKENIKQELASTYTTKKGRETALTPTVI
jgi:hypothetical protein